MRLACALVIVALSASVVRAEPCDCKVIDPGKPQRHAALWTAVGAGALFAGSFALSYYEKARWNDAVQGARLSDPAAVEKANDANHAARVYGTGLFVAGTIALGVAGYLYFTAPDKEVIVAPAASSNQVGLAVAGRF